MVTSVFDPLVAKYNQDFKRTKENFGGAKAEVIDTLQHAMDSARSPDLFMKYAEMQSNAEKIQGWDKLLQFIYNEKLASEKLRTTKYKFV